MGKTSWTGSIDVGWSAAKDEQCEPGHSQLWLEKGDCRIALYLMASNSAVFMDLVLDDNSEHNSHE